MRNFKNVLCCIAAVGVLSACTKKGVITSDGENAGAAGDVKLKTESGTPVHVTKTNVFSNANSGQTDYHSYYAPAIVYCTNTSTIVAFAEGRIGSGNDGAPSDIVSQRSFDNGVTWASFGKVVGNETASYTNATAVYDPNHGGTEGRIWLFCNKDDNTVHAYYNDHSAAPGTAWTEVSNTNMYNSSSVLNGVGPGVGIVMRANSNWIVIPAENRNIVSKDGGSTWQQYSLKSGSRSGESTIFEGDDSRLHRNDRPSGGTGGTWPTADRDTCRSNSIDPAGTWEAVATVDTHLPDPKCEGSIVYYSSGNVVFCNSAHASSRYYTKVRVSTDNGKNWSAGQYLYSAGASGKGGYTSMARVGDFSIGVLCNTASDPGSLTSTSNHWRIDFHRINLPWITQ